MNEKRRIKITNIFRRKVKCMYCGTPKIYVDAKYCRECGGEYGTNYKCGYKKKPHNCGQLQCPRYRLFLMDISSGRINLSQVRNRNRE